MMATERETSIMRTMLVEAEASTIWKALTRPELTKLYMNGWMPQSSWKLGSEVVWMDHVEGTVNRRGWGTLRACIPERRLRYTLYRPDSKLPDEAPSYTTVDIVLDEERSGRTKVTLWHGDFAGLPNDVRRARQAGREWVEALVGLKRVAEEQEGKMAA